ncbi:hypothetical protein B7494_g2941 [Chlorociboria aeruginascens]|nr:hypothetical protein B7494_g2941 [Chlorociboria aeruginascens]
MPEASEIPIQTRPSTSRPINTSEIYNARLLLQSFNDIGLYVAIHALMTTRRMPLMEISENDATSSPVATEGRRKSGRAVRVPDKFMPDMSSSQADTSVKRKRPIADVGNDASDVEEDEEIDDEEESLDKGEARESRKKSRKPARKPAAKKPKVNGDSSNGGAPAIKLPNRPKKGKKVAIADASAGGLYAEVYKSGDSSGEIARRWLLQFAEDPPKALTELINFILKSTGCNSKVTEDDINDPENITSRLSDLQDEFQAQKVADYPLISKAKSSHTFRANLIGFIDSLIRIMHETGALYEEVALMENISQWTTVMSSSTARPFRHTATLVALTIASAICAVAKAQVESAAKTLRLLEGEKRKKGTNKARVAEFQKMVDAGTKKKEAYDERLKEIFDTVYIHRYRDVDPKIRLECVEALGDWILTLPGTFFDGSYLRYMGWMISDANSQMRQGVIKKLKTIMRDPSNIGVFRHFIERFRPRLIEIATRDSEPGVRSAAVDLIDRIREAGMLEPDDIDVIGKLIFDSESSVRQSVVGFFVENVQDLYDVKVEELGGEETLEGILAIDEEDLESPRAEWIKFKSLAEILMSYDIEDRDEMPSQIHQSTSRDYLVMSTSDSRFTLAAQALYTKMPEIKNWEVLAGYLLFDHSAKPSKNAADVALKQSFKPEENEESMLLEILNSSVKISLESLDEPKDRNRKRATRGETEEARGNIARSLAALIPRLLKKYGADPKTAAVVLRLEHVLNLGVFQELRQDSTAYTKLLDEISAQFKGHADKSVLIEAGAALLHARAFEELEEITESKMQPLWEDTIKSLRDISKTGVIGVRGGLRDAVLELLSNNLARMEMLASISSCVDILEEASGSDQVQAIKLLLDVVARGQLEEPNPDIDPIEDEIVTSAINASMFYFMWKVRALTELVSLGESISDSGVDQLKELQDTFNSNLIATISSRLTLDPLRLSATGTLLDLYTLFATSLRPSKKPKGKQPEGLTDPNNVDGYLQMLVHEIDPEVQTELTSIFDAVERQYAKRSNKKLADPGDDEEPQDLDLDSDEDDENVTDNERHSETLRAEQQLCGLTGKLVLAILAEVIDAVGPSKGKLRTRIQRNRTRLGPNFREVVTYLDTPKRKKSHKSKEATKTVIAKSKEIVEEDDEEDPFADEVPEEGTEEDLRRRELLDGDPPVSVDEEAGDRGQAGDSDEDDMLGD